MGYLLLINYGEVQFGFSSAVEAEYTFIDTSNQDRKTPISEGLAPCSR